jgi:hypothetical protein
MPDLPGLLLGLLGEPDLKLMLLSPMCKVPVLARPPTFVRYLLLSDIFFVFSDYEFSLTTVRAIVLQVAYY